MLAETHSLRNFTLGALVLLAATSVVTQSYAVNPGWQPPGWVDNTNPGPPMPKPQPTPRDNPKRINPLGDPDVQRGVNEYCKSHHGGVCG